MIYIIETFVLVDDLKNHVVYSIKSYFAELCDILNVETEISEEINARYKTNKEIVQKIIDEEKELAKLLQADEIKNFGIQIAKNLNEFAMKNIHFHCQNIKISSYNIEAIFALYNEPSSYGEYELIEEDELKTILDCDTGSFEDCDLNIFGNDKNMDYLSELINKQFNGYISVFNVYRQWGTKSHY